MNLSTAILRSGKDQAFSPSLDATIVSMGNPPMLFLDGASIHSTRRPRLSDLRPLKDLGNYFVQMMVDADDWLPIEPISPLVLLAMEAE